MSVKPADLAIVILKVNLLIFIVTLGVNTLTLFPYLMHLNQINNNIALDVANRNFISEDDLEKYLEHLTYDYGHDKASTFSIMTYKDIGTSAFSGEMTAEAVSTAAQNRGVTVFAQNLQFDSNSFTIISGGSAAIGVDIETIDDSQSLILDVQDSFNPLDNNSDMMQGMDSGFGNGKIVNRGHAFNVELKTRYKITGAAFGFFLTMALPVTVETVGVTTQYYQYDK